LVKARRRILLYGNSLISGVIGAGLRRCSGLETTALTTSLPNMQALNAPRPDILLFDSEVPHTQAVFSLLKADPAVMLIGVSPGTNLVDDWSGRQLRELSMQGLLDLIKSAANGLRKEGSDDSGGDIDAPGISVFRLSLQRVPNVYRLGA